MKPNSKQYAKSLIEILDESKDNKKIKTTLDNFVALLAKNNQLSQIGKIVKYFNSFWNEKNNFIESEITSMRKLKKQEISEISKSIKSLSTGKDLDITEKIDNQLIGGIIIRYGDKMIDYSIKNKIKNLKNKLIK